MDPVEIRRNEIENDPYIVWNSFLEISGSHPDKLTDIQKIGHYVLRYDGEINNGGHFQFFGNARPGDAGVRELIRNTMEALTHMCADEHKAILQRAASTYLFDQDRLTSSSQAGDNEVDDLRSFDDEFYDCFPDMAFYIEAFVRLNQDEFVRIID